MRRRERSPEGFTLLELLIVLCVIGVLSCALVLSTRPSDAAFAEREARRLATLLELAAAEARVTGRPIAWSPEPGGYSFWRRNDEGEWSRFPDSDLYRHRSVGESIVLDGARVVLAPVGLQGRLEATISRGDVRILLKGEALGRISVQRLHAD